VRASCSDLLKRSLAFEIGPGSDLQGFISALAGYQLGVFILFSGFIHSAEFGEDQSPRFRQFIASIGRDWSYIIGIGMKSGELEFEVECPGIIVGSRQSSNPIDYVVLQQPAIGKPGRRIRIGTAGSCRYQCAFRLITFRAPAEASPIPEKTRKGT